MRARTRAPEVRRGELLDAALALFAEHGYEGTSVGRIIDVAGVSKGGFYHHFKSKDELLGSLVDRLAETTASALANIVDDQALSPIEKLRGFFVGAEQKKREAVGDAALAQLGLALYDRRNLPLLTGLEQASLALSLPFLERILKSGAAAGCWMLDDVGLTARHILLLGQGVIRDAMRTDVASVPAGLSGYRRAVERWLALDEGTLG